MDRYVEYSVCHYLLCVEPDLAATALGGTLAQLIGLRFLSARNPWSPSKRWIRFHFAEKERGLAIGDMTGTKIGPAIGAPLAAWLINLYDWRMMFIILGVGSMIWLVPWLFAVRDDDRQIEKAAAAANQVGATSFWGIMASPVIWGTIIGTFCYMYFVYFCMTWMPAYFVERRHLSLGDMGLYTFFSFGGMAAVSGARRLGSGQTHRAPGHNPVFVRKAFTIAGFLIEVVALSPTRFRWRCSLPFSPSADWASRPANGR